ncbi:hypothetical protein [Flaviaesturariibacter terrae]
MHYFQNLGITEYFEWAAFLAGLLLLRGRPGEGWRPFLLYLALVLLIEAGGGWMKARWGAAHHLNNYPFYNGLIAVQAFFFYWLFNRVFAHQKNARMVSSIFLGGFALFFGSEALTHPFFTYYLFSRILLAAILLFASCYFFLDLLRNNITDSPLRVPFFWIVTGLFFFYLGTIPFLAFRSQIAAYRSAHPDSNIGYIVVGASVVLYTCWIIAFLCKRKEPQWKPS